MTIHQEVTINCAPDVVFSALTDGNKFSEVTGAPAEVSAVEGEAFSAFGGRITGRNIEVSDNVRLVQAWRAGAWPQGAYSIVSFALEKDGNATRLTLDHDGYPQDAEEHLAGGWPKMYWEPLKAYCE